MPEITPGNIPPSYDNEQARQFYRSATNPRVLPKKYWPDREVEFWDFNDAVIAQYEAAITRKYQESRGSEEPGAEMSRVEIRKRKLAENVYQRELARIAWAVEYVQGMPLADIKDAVNDNLVMQKEGVFGYVLKVARGGSREIKRIHTEDKAVAQAVASSLDQTDVVSIETPDEKYSLEILTEYVNLEDRIKLLHEKHRMSTAQAQALILLFELQRSRVAPARQIRALHNASNELVRKIKTLISDEEKANNAEDSSLEKGLAFITEITGQPSTRTLGLRPYLLVQKMEQDTKNTVNQLHIRDHIHSHIGYALEKLYP